MKYECPSCGNILSTVEEGCNCGRKGKFKLLMDEQEVKGMNSRKEKLLSDVENTRQLIIDDLNQLYGPILLDEEFTMWDLIKKIKSDKKRIDTLIDSLNELEDIILRGKSCKIETDRIGSFMTPKKRGYITTVKEIIDELEELIGKTIPYVDLVEAARSKGISEDELADILEKLKRGGDIFEPRKGFVSKF